MARSYVRSFRIDDEIAPLLEDLPKGTANTLVNGLLARYFTDKDLQSSIPLKDERFPSDEPITLDQAPTETEPTLTRPSKPTEAEVVTDQVAVEDTTVTEIKGGNPSAPMPDDFLKKPEPEVKAVFNPPTETSSKSIPEDVLPGF